MPRVHARACLIAAPKDGWVAKRREGPLLLTKVYETPERSV
jgi:hypothetical protein